MQIWYAIVTICTSMHFKHQNRFAGETGKTLESAEGSCHAP